MNIIQFKYAIEVERTGSISQAAENLYMAQPNLSKAIRELEETWAFPCLSAHRAAWCPRGGAWNSSNWRGACFCRWSRWRPSATNRAATCRG